MPQQQITGAHPTDATREQKVIADPYVQALNVIDAIHEMMHQGRHFVQSGEDAAVADAASINFLMVVPEGTVPHLRIAGVDATGAPIKIYVFEDTAVSANGVAQISVNNNRLSTRAAKMQVFKGPTITNDGTEIRYKLIPGAKQSGGDGDTYFNEWILQPGKNYLVRITNASGQAQTIGHTFEWYEA